MGRYDKRPDIVRPNLDLPPPTLQDFGISPFYRRAKTEEHPEYDDGLFLRGIGNTNARIMFITACPEEEDIDCTTSEPRHLKSGQGVLFRRLCLANGIDLETCYFTSLCKYALPRNAKKKPSASDIAYCKAMLEEEIALVKPTIIVCVGKEPVTYILDLNIKLQSLEECCIYSTKYNAAVLVITNITLAYFKPEYQDKLELELGLLSKYDNAFAKGLSIQKIKQEYRFIDSYEKLDSWIKEMDENNFRMFAVDCEWRGSNHVDGNLRSIQFCWKAGQAVYLHLFDENNQWCFPDANYDQVKTRMQVFFNRKDVKYVGHNFSADSVFMKNHLGLDVYDNKCIFDTMFAMQTANEYADLKLEKLAAQYTDMGRYDIDLLLWKHQNKGTKFEETDGYGAVPTSILWQYGCRDVDATFRLYSTVFKFLLDDNTLDYYLKIKHPFVTEGFSYMMDSGLPVSSDDAEQVRLSFLSCSFVLEEMFYDMLRKESIELLTKELLDKAEKVKNVAELTAFINRLPNPDLAAMALSDMMTDASKMFKSLKDYQELIPFLQHYYKCMTNTFNAGSAPDKINWLFKVKKYRPVKTTKNEDGLSTLWEKIEVLPPKEQARYQPAVDKATIKSYADAGDAICAHLLQLTAVRKVTESFLKGKDGGFSKYIASDGRLHPLYACTETGRPRSFKPNILNIPKEVSDSITKGFKKVEDYFGVKTLEDGTKDYSRVDDVKFNKIKNLIKATKEVDSDITIEDLQPKPLRWIFKAPDGMAFVDADYVSAEVWAIAYLSNDQKLIKALTEPDPQFASLKGKRVRIKFDDDIVAFTDDVKKPELLHDPNDPELDRDENGNLKHPKRDIYWELVESKYYMNTPREILETRYNGNGRAVYRTSGKIANFLITYGGTAGFLQKQIELVTATKQEEGTGQKIIDAFQFTRPDCWEFKTYCESLPDTVGYYVSPSGYKRHFRVPAKNVPRYIRDKVVAPLQRQACNVGMQSLVADSLARATYWLNTAFRNKGMQARAIIPLYDALYVLCPYKEIDTVRDMIKEFMSDKNYWDLPGGRLIFRLDFELTKRWASTPTKEELEEIEQGRTACLE